MADKYNIILIETPAGIDVIFCDNNNPFTSYNSSGDKATLFENLEKVSNDKSLKTVGNVNVMIASLVINEILNQLQVSNIFKQVGDIISLDLTDFTGYKMNESNLKDNWQIIRLNYSDRIPDNISGNVSDSFAKVFYLFNKLLNNLSGFENVSATLADRITRQFKDGKLNDLLLDKTADFKSFDYKSMQADQKIYVLESLRQVLRENYPQYFSGKRIMSDVTMLMDQIEIALSILQNRELNFEKDISRYG